MKVDFVNRILNFTHTQLNIVMGIIMLAVAVVNFQYYNDLQGELFFEDVLRYGSMIIGGIVIVLDANRNVFRTISIFALCLSIGHFITAWDFLSTRVDTGGDLDPIFMVMFLIGIVYLYLAGSLLHTSYSYFKKRSVKRTNAMAVALVMISIEIIPMALMIRDGMSIMEYMEDYKGGVFYILLYLAFFVLLDSDQVRLSTVYEGAHSSMRDIRLTYAPDSLHGISADDVDLLMQPSKNKGWTPIDDGGPAEIQMKFPIKKLRESSYVTVQKWKGSDSLYFTISSNPSGTLINAKRFEVVHISLDGKDAYSSTRIRLYSPDGSVTEMDIEQPEVGQ